MLFIVFFYIASCTLQERIAETEACDVIQNHSHDSHGPKFSLKQQTFIEFLENIWYIKYDQQEKIFESLYIVGKLPTYPFPKPTLTLTSQLGQNGGIGEG